MSFFCIRPPPVLLPVLGLLERYMTPTLDAALLWMVPRSTFLVVYNGAKRHLPAFPSTHNYRLKVRL